MANAKRPQAPLSQRTYLFDVEVGAMNKYRLLPVCLGMFILLMSGCPGNDDSETRAMKHVHYSGAYEVFDALEDLVRRSGGAAEVRRTGHVEKARHDQYPELIQLLRTEFVVIRSIADDSLSPGDTIFIQEIDQFAYLPYEKQEHYLFLLYPNHGNDKVYGVAGGYQGAFKIIRNRVIYDADQYGGYKGFQDELNNLKVEEAIAKLETVFQEVKGKE